MSRVQIGPLGNCPICLMDLGSSDDCPNCQALWENAHTCDCCGELMRVDEEWQRRKDRNGYVHVWCDDRLNTKSNKDQ